MEPQIQYATTEDGVSIAYWAMGRGPATLFLISPWSNLTAEWDVDDLRMQYTAAAKVSTFVRLDPRGCGLSDRDPPDFELDRMVLDIEAVVDQLDQDHIFLYAVGYSAITAIAYAGRRPDRVTHLAVTPALVRGHSIERHRKLEELAEIDWNLATDTAMRAFNPEWSDDLIKQFGALTRASFEPDTFVRFVAAERTWNAEEAAATVQAKTLLLHDRSNPDQDLAETRRTASLIKNSRVVFVNDTLEATVLVQRFFADLPLEVSDAPPEPPSVPSSSTAIILFADIAGSTALTERLGDAAFRDKARELDDALRAAITSNGGTAIEGKLLGDGVLATFGAAREAIACAAEMHRLAAGAGGGPDPSPLTHDPLSLHVGVHAGDVIREDNNVYGGAVNIAARVASEAGAGETLVSATVRDLARTSAGVSFEDRGERELKGVGEPVRVWAVVAGTA